MRSNPPTIRESRQARLGRIRLAYRAIGKVKVPRRLIPSRWVGAIRLNCSPSSGRPSVAPIFLSAFWIWVVFQTIRMFASRVSADEIAASDRSLRANSTGGRRRTYVFVTFNDLGRRAISLPNVKIPYIGLVMVEVQGRQQQRDDRPSNLVERTYWRRWGESANAFLPQTIPCAAVGAEFRLRLPAVQKVAQVCDALAGGHA
ncbi:hypothetical protein PMI06_008504 [Burkholderia sp. BT03]|nr:hypothetical protein PMI06_008504 [Burkholderia sp. BT03]